MLTCRGRESLYSDAGNANSLAALFSASGLLSSGQVIDIVAHYGTYVPADGPFWDTVATLDEFEGDEAAVLEARRLVTLAGLAFSHAPTVAAITTAISHGAASLTATLTPSQWTTLVATIAELPPGVEGASNSAQRANYAASLRENALAAFPGTGVGFSIRADATLGDVHGFANLGVNTAFDFERDDVLERVDGDYRWEGTDAQRSAAAAFQRVSRIAPSATRFTSAKAIYAAGLRSGHAIARRGAKRGVAQLILAGLTPSDARLTVVRAQQAAGKALTLFTQAHANLTGVKLWGDAAWPNGTGLYSRFLTASTVGPSSTLEAVFGNVDFCTCKDCRSITGPAAYLVDLLHWLDERDGWVGKLKDRRPDLGLLLLSCENTHRTLPYIDLALEVLENAAATVLGVPQTEPYSTDAEGDELLAGPQYVNNQVYQQLTSRLYPISLPFHQSLAEARAFLGHLGVRRTELMRAFQAPGTGPLDAAIRVEELGLFAAARERITEPGDPGEYLRWGTTSGAWPDSLRNVENLLYRAEIRYTDLLDLLHTRYINDRAGPASNGNIYLDPEDFCDLSTYLLLSRITVGWDSTDWDTTFGRIRQLVRLQRACGWTLLDLDKVLDALGVAKMDDTTITDIGTIHEIQRDTGLSPVHLAAWFGSIDAWNDRETASEPVLSLYEAIFLAPSIFPTNDRTVATSTAYQFVLNTGTFEPNGAAGTLDTYASHVQALVGIDADAYQAILDWLTLELAAAPPFTRANLTWFYRWSSLARVVGRTVSDTLALAKLLGSSPFTSPTDAWEFLRDSREVAASGVSFDETRYLVEHDAGAISRVAPADSWFRDVLSRLGDKLRAHFDEAAFSVTSDPDGTLLDALLDAHTFSDRANLDLVIAGTLPLTTPPSAYANAQVVTLEGELEGLCDTDAFLAELVRAPADGPLDPLVTVDAEEIARRQLWVAQRLSQWQAAEAIVVAHFSAELGVTEASLQALRGPESPTEALQGLGPLFRLDGSMSTPSGSFADWVDVYLHAHFRDAGLTAASPDAVDATEYALELDLAGILTKFARVVSGLGLADDEVTFWVSNG